MEQSDDKLIRKVYTVSKLTGEIKSILESRFPFVWVTGEISNLRIPGSGHSYFSLKDSNAQISAVLFRGQKKNLKFKLEDGLNVTGLGRISVYEPRGSYQLIFELLEPKGIGALQVAFEQLKQRLFEEGLFDDQFKRPLPFLPDKISVITSPSGAVIHDILHTVNRRFPSIQIEIIPTQVQGEMAEDDIVNAINLMNSCSKSDVAILARGGGSLEDLAPFNTERVARAVFNSDIPIVSAIGHETDYTICDFIADLRAPTPSAAAEMVVPVYLDLKSRISELSQRLKLKLVENISSLRVSLCHMNERLVDPRKKMDDLRLKIDDYRDRLIQSHSRLFMTHQDKTGWLTHRLITNNPIYYTVNYNAILNKIIPSLHRAFTNHIDQKHSFLRELNAELNALNPVSILRRGYSITRTAIEKKVIFDPDEVEMEQDLEIMITKGLLYCRIKGKSRNAEKNI